MNTLLAFKWICALLFTIVSIYMWKTEGLAQSNFNLGSSIPRPLLVTDPHLYFWDEPPSLPGILLRLGYWFTAPIPGLSTGPSRPIRVLWKACFCLRALLCSSMRLEFLITDGPGKRHPRWKRWKRMMSFESRIQPSLEPLGFLVIWTDIPHAIFLVYLCNALLNSSHLEQKGSLLIYHPCELGQVI